MCVICANNTWDGRLFGNALAEVDVEDIVLEPPPTHTQSHTSWLAPSLAITMIPIMVLFVVQFNYFFDVMGCLLILTSYCCMHVFCVRPIIPYLNALKPTNVVFAKNAEL